MTKGQQITFDFDDGQGIFVQMLLTVPNHAPLKGAMTFGRVAITSYSGHGVVVIFLRSLVKCQQTKLNEKKIKFSFI